MGEVSFVDQGEFRRMDSPGDGPSVTAGPQGHYTDPSFSVSKEEGLERKTWGVEAGCSGTSGYFPFWGLKIVIF